MKKDTYPSYIKVFEKLPEDEQKKWYSEGQVVMALPLYFLTKENIAVLDESNKIRKKHFLKYTEDYLIYLKHDNHSENIFTDIKYRPVILYNFNDIKENVDKEFFTTYHKNREKYYIQEENKLDDMRSFMSEKRVLNNNKKEDIVGMKFYDVNTFGTKSITKDNTYRTYYGIFMMQPYVRWQFLRKYNLRTIELDCIMHLNVFQHFVKTDIASFFRAAKLTTSKTIMTLVKHMLKEGYIEVVEYSKNSLYKKPFIKNRVGRTRDTIMYRTTPKLNKIAKDYMDYVLLRKKFKFDGQSFSNITETHLDLGLAQKMKNLRRHEYFKTRRTIVSYGFYDEVYQYVNFRQVAEFMDEETYDECMRAGNVFKFNPLLWQLTKTNYLKTQGENLNTQYNQRFLKRHSFGIDID